MCDVLVLYEGYSKKLGNRKMTANCSCTLIKGPKLIIVDTMTAWDREMIVKALTCEGIEPADIDYVVCTHSHADHIGNNNLFTNAEHIVGTCIHRGDIFNEETITSEGYQLCHGVKVVATPGHTSEDVTVLVETTNNGKSSTYAITGDLFEKQEDIWNPSIWQELGTPELQKVQSQMRSRIINVANVIVPGHGPQFEVTDSLRNIVNSQVMA